MLLDHLYISFGKMSLQILCPFLNRVFLVVLGVIYMFWILIPYQYMICKYFLPFYRLHFFTLLIMSSDT